MNLFYLDDDLDLCAEYHVDAHVGKMQLEATQLLSTALWVDKYIGYVPRKLTPEEWQVIKDAKALEPPIDERKFTRYLPCHHNHPSEVWVRSSLEHFYWTINYVNALNSECVYRGYKSHDSCREANRLPEPKFLQDKGFVRPAQAMPPELQSGNIIEDYRLFYMLDKATFAKWKKREKPEWWDESIAMYDRRYTDLNTEERKATGWLN